MTTSQISKSAPFGSAVHSCVTYNNTIYISTQDAIYKYDHINNVYTLLLNKPSFNYVLYKVFTGCVLRDNIIYEGYVYRNDTLCTDPGLFQYSERDRTDGCSYGCGYCSRVCQSVF